MARELNEPLKVLTLGHVVWYKNPEIWLKVASRVIENNKNKEIEFIWAGNGELLDEFLGKLEEIKMLNIKFVGFQKDLDFLYKNVAVYFQPSKIESFGLAVADAMSRGIPCVVSSAGGLPELIIDNKSGFIISASNVDDYVKKISSLLKDIDLNKRMGEAALSNFKNKFTKKLYMQKMVVVHDKALLK